MARQSMRPAQSCKAALYVPGQHLLQSAYFAPMDICSSRLAQYTASINRSHVNKVHQHKSTLSAIEAEMARLYLSRRHSFDDQNNGGQPMANTRHQEQSKLEAGSDVCHCPLRPDSTVPTTRTVPRQVEPVQQYGMQLESPDLDVIAGSLWHPCKVRPSSHFVTSAAVTQFPTMTSIGVADDLKMHSDEEVWASARDSASEESCPASSAPTEAWIGSSGHDRGMCKPCAFFTKRGCSLGASCNFCHLCKAGEQKRRKKKLKESWREVAKPGVHKTVSPGVGRQWPDV